MRRKHEILTIFFSGIVVELISASTLMSPELVKFEVWTKLVVVAGCIIGSCLICTIQILVYPEHRIREQGDQLVEKTRQNRKNT